MGGGNEELKMGEGSYVPLVLAVVSGDR